MKWIDINKEKPKESGPYMVHSPSADPYKPMICMAWYENGKHGYKKGWSLMLTPFIKGITHWMKIEPPVPNKQI